ncbi:phage tail protein [Carnobacterium divergens]|uniref:phage tail protein n=1 Tax=Carnobacterium divergens TaxID=2748 RepID=UPI001073A395|nr:phage tail protein [Carnobacterium divergens]
MMRDVSFIGKSFLNDFNCIVKTGKIGNPSKNKLTEQVAFSNIIQDFSELYGMQTYTERTLEYVINLVDFKNLDEIELYNLETKINNWLMPGMKGNLTDTFVPGFYFEAEVQSGPDFEVFKQNGELTVEFIAYPFKISEIEEGDDCWDSYSLEHGFAQFTSYQINGSKEISLWNVGVNNVSPTIDASQNMTIQLNDSSIKINQGSHIYYDLDLKPGENKLKILGDGLIEFHFRKELI